MDANEFWCRAFLAAMKGQYVDHEDGGRWENHGAPAAYCECAADAALAVAQQRGMVTGERAESAPTAPELERVAFMSERDMVDGLWYICAHGVGVFWVASKSERAVNDSATIRIAWGESMPPQPIEVWIERQKGGA